MQPWTVDRFAESSVVCRHVNLASLVQRKRMEKGLNELGEFYGDTS